MNIIRRYDMGTRSITVVRDGHGNKIIEMYKQFDGYPDGLGKELLDFIKSGKMVNGISDTENSRIFNGIDCFAAQLVCYFKDGPGGVYLSAPSDTNNPVDYQNMYWAEYLYEIDSNLNLKCFDTYNGDEIDLEKIETNKT
jgi:hypothetical protein